MAQPAFDSPEGGFANQMSGLIFSLAANELLEKRLQAAREGRLSVHWREELAPPVGFPGPSAVREDAQKLAVEEIRQRPVAPWEPGHVPHWRTALGSWFADSRMALDQRFTVMTDRARAVRVSAGRMPAGRVRVIPGGPVDSGSLAGFLADQVTALDGQADELRESMSSTYIQERDRLTMSYLAGLAAGGEDVDWKGWFLDRVAAWPAAAAGGKRRAEIELNSGTSTFAKLVQRLPSYWRIGL
ncbi:hypothetical protein ONA92_27140 [Mycobacteroides salmoniphilum]|uniref:hypothetical protein n=1 Tax=Mycobacteroides salmoniphilum TaxID=404941 RepID=UPI0035620AA4